MCQFFKTRGYPDLVIHNSKHRAQSVDPQSVPLSSHNNLEGRIPLTLHPHNISVKNIILKNFKLLQHNPTTAEIFAQPLLISYERDKNFSNFLVKSTLKSDVRQFVPYISHRQFASDNSSPISLHMKTLNLNPVLINF